MSERIFTEDTLEIAINLCDEALDELTSEIERKALERLDEPGAWSAAMWQQIRDRLDWVSADLRTRIRIILEELEHP